MKIELKQIKIKDLVSGYFDNGNGGVIGLNGLLDIRPPYQREFVYKEGQRNKVIETVMNGFPLNVMYWVDKGEIDDKGNKKYEILDGQQRTISICQYAKGMFGLNYMAYHNLTTDKKQAFDDYKLMVYICSGTETEKLEWFKTINIAGEKLTNQELRNAVYTGPWLSNAKACFSKNNCIAYQKGGKLLDGSANRQEYLETALKWISHRHYGKTDIEKYMSDHQNDTNKNPQDIDLWNYFSAVIDWVNSIFTVYRREMKGLDWGILYNLHNTKTFIPGDVEKKVSELMEDSEVDCKKGIYEYILSGDERHLNLRSFGGKDKAQAFEKQMVVGTGKAICPKCDPSKMYSLSEMEADHIVPWSKGGKTTLDNCQMLCKYHRGCPEFCVNGVGIKRCPSGLRTG